MENKLKYAKGGKTISREDIVKVLKDELEDVLEDANQEYEGQEITGEEVEHESRDGFIPYTNGGYEYRFFVYGNHLTGSGKSLPTNTLDAELERVENLNYEYGKERFEEEFPDIVKELGGIEKVDYSSLQEAGYMDEAEELDEFSRSDDDSIMFEVEAFYYNPDNDKGIDGKHTIVLSGSVNMEAPYHRTGNYEDYTQDKFTFDSIEDLKEKLQKGIDKISKWFDGENYKEGRELKMGRFAKGGKLQVKGLEEKALRYWQQAQPKDIKGDVISFDDFKEDLKKMAPDRIYAKGGEVKFRKLANSKNFDIVTPDGRYEIEMGAFGIPKSIIDGDTRKDINTNPIAIKYRGEIQKYIDANYKFAKGGTTKDYSYDYEDIGQFSMDRESWSNYTNKQFEKIGKDIVENDYDGNVKKAYDSIVRKKFAKGGVIEERVYAVDMRADMYEDEGFFTYNQFQRYADELSDDEFMDEAENQGLVWSSMDNYMDSNEYNENGDNLVERKISVEMRKADEYVNPMFLAKGGKITGAGKSGLDKIKKTSKDNPSQMYKVTDDNYSNIGNFYLKNGKFAKMTVSNADYDFAYNKVSLRPKSDVIYKATEIEGKGGYYAKGGSLDEETLVVDVVWRQLDEKGLGKFNLKESDVERLEDNYGSTYYFEIYNDTNEKPISYTKMKNILDKSMKEMGLMDSNFAKGGMTGYNKFFDKFKRSDSYISEPRKTAKGNYIVEVDPHDKETSKKMKDYMQSEGIGYSPKPMGKGFYTQFEKGGVVEKIKKQAKAKNKRTGNTYLVIQRVDDKDEVAYIEDIDFSNDLLGKYDNWEVIDIYRTDYDYAKGGKIMKTYDDFDRDYDEFTDYVMDRIDLDERRKIRDGWNKKSRENREKGIKGGNEMRWENYLLKRVNEKSYAKGGKVKKKENNQMLIGGLAGILLGIFLKK
jgi:hypothetical protein|tara:strand:+ start:7281 stop:10067 length:2787 start_codon:yes stop_codon:yes gene_type:complete